MGAERTWLARSYIDGDDDGIYELWKVSFPLRKYEREQWMGNRHWMYKENPYGYGWVWVAEDGGKIVGHSSIIPVKLKVGNETVIGFQSIGTMTHPDYRRKGIYQTLAKMTYAEAAKDGVSVGFRFPNENSRQIAIQRLNWFDVSRPKIWFRPYHWRKAIKLRVENRVLAEIMAACATLIFNKVSLRTSKPPIVQGLDVVRIVSFDEQINELWDRVSNQSHIMVVRDKEYLNWKYCAAPENYKIYVAKKERAICGYVVLRCIQHGHTKVGRFFDILAESKEIAQCLIAEAVSQCEKEGVALIYCSIINDNIYIKALRNNGFVHTPFIKGGWFCAYSDSPHISDKILGNHHNWYIQTGDSDKV